MNYSLKELHAELEDQKYELTPGGVWVIDFNDVIRAIGNLEKEVREMLYFLKPKTDSTKRAVVAIELILGEEG